MLDENIAKCGRPFASFDVQAALRIRTAIARMENGNFSNVKAVGQGVSEYKLDFGSGYRIYFGKDAIGVHQIPVKDKQINAANSRVVAAQFV